MTSKIRAALVAGVAALTVAAPVALGTAPAASAKIPIDPAAVIKDIVNAVNQNAKWEEMTWVEAETADRDTHYEYNVMVISASAFSRYNVSFDPHGGPNNGEPLVASFNDNGWTYYVYVFDTGTFNGNGYDWEQYPTWARFRGDYHKSGRNNDVYNFNARPCHGNCGGGGGGGGSFAPWRGEHGANNNGQRGNHPDGVWITIVNQWSGRAIDQSGGRADNGNPVQSYPQHSPNEPSQAWRLDRKPEGAFALTSGMADSQVLDVSGRDTHSVQTYRWLGSFNQQWYFNPVGDGYYEMRSRAANNVCLNDNGYGRQLTIEGCNGSSAQHWGTYRY